MPDHPTPLPDDALPESSSTAPEPTSEPAPGGASPASAAANELSPAATAAELAARFPAVFAGGAFKPLKLRIQADIQQRAPGVFTRKSLSIFLHRHTTSTAYLKALAGAAQRADLDGLAAGEVSEEHRAAAVAELARRRALHDERRAAEHAAQRQAREADLRARAERAALLRSFETTTLTRANFCALKGVSETGLDALLAQAKLERDQRPAAPRAEAAAARPGPRHAHAQRPASGPRGATRKPAR